MWFDFFLIVSGWRILCLLSKTRQRDKLGFEGRLKSQVGKMLQRVFGGQNYEALRIPDTGHRGFQDFDVLLLTDRELYVLAVNNLAGHIRMGVDDSWSLINQDGTIKVHANDVLELKEKINVLVSYLARRGISLPVTFLKPRVIFVNHFCRPEQQILLQPEVFSYDQWQHFLKTGSGQGIFGHTGSMNLQSVDSFRSQLQFILSTAPTWDRLEMRGGGILWGEFHGFEGQTQDVETLKAVKRSKISQLEATHQASLLSFLGFQDKSAEVRVVCTLRDYRQNASGQCGRSEIQVMADLEIVFLARGDKQPRQFKLKDIVRLTLRA